MEYLILGLFIHVILSVGVAGLAINRAQSGLGYFLLSLALSPILGVAVLFITQQATAE